jgi:7,8-dihydropterin-6-yl-methyl-4-(beta-D-ribofuranosyl)aminobenzene 5'-phosphate synthase
VKVTITILVDDRSTDEALVVEHGFAAYVEAGESRVLFDTGQRSETLKANAERLGVDLASAGAIVISHGHYDHTGGLAAALAAAPRAPLYLHRRATQRRFRKAVDGPAKEIGMPGEVAAAVRDAGERVVYSDRHQEIADGAFVTGIIPRRNDREGVGGFCWDEACSDLDWIPDDQALFVPTAEGNVVLLGCAHAGVINTLDHIAKLSGDDRVRAVAGGMHLLHADANRLEATADAFRRHGARLIAPCHCTGGHAIDFLSRAFPEEFQPCACGSVLRLNLS